MQRMPVVYLPHGGGPWPFVETGIGEKSELEPLAAYLRSLHDLPKDPPKALLCISAHWEESIPTVMSSPKPPMLYDYFGFPPEAYTLTWPAPGNPELCARIRALLTSCGMESGEDTARGFDHGTFVPLKLAWPDAEIPTVQLSLVKGLDPKAHIALGRALAPLRDEGVYILGSGLSYHNLRAFGPKARPASEAFDAWLRETAELDSKERDARLIEWSSAPSAREVHPREEHLLPMMVAAGAAGTDRGTMAYSGTILGVRVSAYHFG